MHSEKIKWFSPFFSATGKFLAQKPQAVVPYLDPVKYIETDRQSRFGVEADTGHAPGERHPDAGVTTMIIQTGRLEFLVTPRLPQHLAKFF
jgi:hypothetical protein